MQWNFSYQRQLAKDWLATATYIGNRTNHILGANEINVPQPSPTATTFERAGAPLSHSVESDARRIL